MPVPTAPAGELVIRGRLKQIALPPAYCGYFYYAGVAEYTDLTVVSGTYSHDAIYVVHGCAFDYKEHFEVGEYYELRLTLQPGAGGAGMIVLGDIKLPYEVKPQFCDVYIDTDGQPRRFYTSEALVASQEGMMYYCEETDRVTSPTPSATPR